MSEQPEFKATTPEEALEIADQLVGLPIPAELANWGAGMALLFQDAMTSECACVTCVRVREMISNLMESGLQWP